MAGTTKEYIESLNSFTNALEELVKTLVDKEKKSGSDGSDVLQDFFTSSAGHFEMIEAISEDVKSIREDVKKTNAKSDDILKAIKESKDKKDKGVFESISKEDSKKSIFSGVKTIILIAGAILAIGMAFKLIGSIDILTVLALSFALPLIADAFSKVAENSDKLDFNTMINISSLLVLMSISIMLSSHILSKVSPISAESIMSAIAIGFVFTILAFGVSIITETLKDISLSEIILVGSIIVILSTAIVISSYILQYTAKVPFLNVIISSLAIGIATVIMSLAVYAITKLLDEKSAIQGSLLLIIISTAIMTSSHILALGNYSNQPPINWTIGAGLSIFLIIPAILILGIPVLAPIVLLGSLMMVLVSTAIMTSSHILSEGNYTKFPDLKWNIGVTSAILLFGGTLVTMGFMALMLPVMLLGVVLMREIAYTIVDISNILSEGNFSNSGDLTSWAASTVLLFTVFTPMMILLGTLSAVSGVITFFGGDNPMEKGRELLKQIAWTMVDISNILSTGKFKGGPSSEWAHGVGYSLVMFMKALNMAQPDTLNWWTGGGSTIQDKVNNLKQAIYAMVGIAEYLGEITGAGIFDSKKAPSKEWAEGVGTAITMFMKSLNSANDKSLIDGMTDLFGGDSMGDKMDVLYRVIDFMTEIANKLNSNNVSFSGAPSEKWSSSIESVYKSFANISGHLSGAGGFFSGGPSDIIGYMKLIAQGYVDTSDILGKVKGGIDDPFMTASKGIDALANAFNNMSNAIKNIGSSTKNLSYEAIDLIKSVSLSIMALSTVDANNLENVLGKLKPEDVAKMYALSSDSADKSAKNVNKGGSSWFGSGEKNISKNSSNLEAQKQTTELINIKKELIKMNMFVSKLVNNTDEMLDFKISGGGASITH